MIRAREGDLILMPWTWNQDLDRWEREVLRVGLGAVATATVHLTEGGVVWSAERSQGVEATVDAAKAVATNALGRAVHGRS